MLSKTICIPLFISPLMATPLPVGPFPTDAGSVRAWPLAAGSAYRLAPEADVALDIQVPAREGRELEAAGQWRGTLIIDLFGTDGAETTTIFVEAVDPETGQVITSQYGEIQEPAPRSPWVVIASSEHPGAAAALAFDGNPNTDWHSNYQGGPAPRPHWIGLQFGQPTALTSIKYTPRQAGFTNGVARKYRVEILDENGAWQAAAAGETDRRVANERSTLEVALPAGVETDGFRFVIESDWSGGGHGTAGLIEAPGVVLDAVPPVAANRRMWMEFPPTIMQSLEGKSFTLRIRNGKQGAAVIGTPTFARTNTEPSPKLFGRSNGGLGPDKLGAGLLGFDALTEHRQHVLSVMHVRRNSPAARQDLRRGDVILAVRERPLPLNNVAPGWTWFHDSHEAVLGRETEAALHAGETHLPITVMRDGRPTTIEIPLTRNAPFTSMIPAEDPEAARMLDDCIGFLIRAQRDDGSWSGCMIRSSFSALALLATGDEAHRPRVERAVRWAQQRFKAPDDYGNLGFWSGAFAGLLYAEWHLATGDTSVVENMQALQQWALAGHHNSIWDVPALGHGPSGLPYGQKALVAPAAHLLVFEALAMRGGMESGLWELLKPYMEMSWSNPADGGNGTIGYNRSMKDLEEFWSRSGLFAMAAHLRGERPDMRDSMVRIMHERHPWFRNSHAYGEPGGALGLLALNLIDPQIHAEVIREYAWWFSLAWEPGYGLRFTTPHMGAPYMGEDDLLNAAYALVLQAPARTLHLTGLPQNSRQPD